MTQTPKEKAEELFNKYATYAVMWTGGPEVEKQNCKQCALIAVDGIIEATKYEIQHAKAYIGGESEITTKIHYNQFWQEVKQEIEKL